MAMGRRRRRRRWMFCVALPDSANSATARMRAFVLVLFLLTPFASQNGVRGKRSQTCKCPQNDIVISQAQSLPQRNGIPTFLVDIPNTCHHGCAIPDIHLHCGAFSSRSLIQPQIFRRMAIDNCLINNGYPLPTAHTLSFLYNTTPMFHLSVSSFVCRPPIP